MEAQVLAVKGKHYPGRMYQIVVQDKDGSRIRIRMQKEKKTHGWKNVPGSILEKWNGWREKLQK